MGLPCLLIVLVGGCATIPEGDAVSPAVTETVETLETGTVGEVVAISSLTFLFDTEVLVRESDVRLAVEAIQRSSSAFETTGTERITDARSVITAFGDRFEVHAFAAEYLPEEAYLVTVATDGGEVRLILGDRIGSARSILGVMTR